MSKKKQSEKEAKRQKKQEKKIRKAAKKLMAQSCCASGKNCKKSSKKLGKKEKKKSKGRKEKAARSLSCSFDLGKCPCCSKHCPLAKPKCGKGRAYARKKTERLIRKMEP